MFLKIVLLFIFLSVEYNHASLLLLQNKLNSVQILAKHSFLPESLNEERLMYLILMQAHMN